MLCAIIRSCGVSSEQLLITRRAMSFNIEERGSPNTLDYRVFFSKSRNACMRTWRSIIGIFVVCLCTVERFTVKISEEAVQYDITVF